MGAWAFGIGDGCEGEGGVRGSFSYWGVREEEEGPAGRGEPRSGGLEMPDAEPFFSERLTREVAALLPGFHPRGGYGLGLAEQGRGGGGGAVAGKGEGKKLGRVEDGIDEDAFGGGSEQTGEEKNTWALRSRCRRRG